ncbi:MAG: hypothetical protein WCZ28_06175 [Burkholderiaceae bacterium]
MDRPAAQFDLGYWMGSAAQRLAALEKGQSRLDGELAALKREVATAFTWARRVALLAVLWTGAIGVNLDPAMMADLALQAVRLVLRGG